MRRPGRIVLALIVVLLLVGCSGTSSLPDDESTRIEVIVSDGFADQRNVLVDATTCDAADADHYDCTVSYETPEGVHDIATVSVACDTDRCVWKED